LSAGCSSFSQTVTVAVARRGVRLQPGRPRADHHHVTAAGLFDPADTEGFRPVPGSRCNRATG
jgi:hypothetical protein